MRSTAGPCYEDWDSFANDVDPDHRNPYRAASRGRVVRLWGGHENVAGNHAVCLLVRPFASTHLVAVEGFFSVVLSVIVGVEKADGTFHHVLERRCPQLEQYMNRPEAVAPVRKRLYGRAQSVLDGGKAIVCRRCVSRSRASGARAGQTCEQCDRTGQSCFPPPLMSVDLYPLASLEQIENTPSRLDGIPTGLEEDLRTYGCKLIAEAGVLLNQCVG